MDFAFHYLQVLEYFQNLKSHKWWFYFILFLFFSIFLNLSFLGIVYIYIFLLPLVLKQSLIWRFKISSVTKARKYVNNNDKNVFFHDDHWNVLQSLIRKYCFLSPSAISNNSTWFTTFFWYIDSMFFFILIAQDTNANVIFLSILWMSLKIEWKFYVFKIKPLCKIFIRFYDSSWIMLCRIWVSD